MARPTVHDVARDAGVSLATVDRVLNARPGVRPQTIAKVFETIDRIGYVRDVTAANLARQRDYELVFVLPEGHGALARKLVGAISEAQRRSRIDRTNIAMLQVAMGDPHAVARTLAGLNAATVDGVAIMAPETPQLRDAIRHLKENNVAVVAIISDLPNCERDEFVGINNIAAGRTAGLLLGRFVGSNPAEVLVLAGSMLARDHSERRLGFDQIISERFPALTVLPTIEVWDDAARVEALLPSALANHPDVKGIYCLGGGNAGLVKVLRSHGLEESITVISHELTETSKAALMDGTFDAVIAQDFGHVVRSAIRVLKAHRDRIDVNPSQERIRIDVLLRENLG
jgi:LacI family transcriptional regulator